MDRVGYWAIEAWGGATFDTCLRFLDENPWDRLRSIKSKTPNTRLSMLSRGQNLVGYKHYSKDIVNRFIAAAHRNGIDVFRVFDALNDIRNVVDNAEAIKACGGHFEGAISYTLSPVHTLDSFLEYGQQLKDLGADSIAIKDMAGMLTPYRTERIVKAFNAEIGLPIHVHCHYVGGMAPANYLKAAEAGAAIVDTASAPLAFGNSQPAVEMLVAAMQESRYDTGLDLGLLFEISGVLGRGSQARALQAWRFFSYPHEGLLTSGPRWHDVEPYVAAGNPECNRSPRRCYGRNSSRSCRGGLSAAGNASFPDRRHAGRVQCSDG